MEMEVKESVSLEEGRHEGAISRIEYRHEPFEYTDVFIKVDGHNFEMKYGAPSNLSMNSKLGKLVGLYQKLTPGEKIDIDKVLIGKRISFVTTNEETPKGTFARIVDDSLKAVDGGVPEVKEVAV